MDETEGGLEEKETGRLRLDLWRSERAARTAAITALLAHELRQPLAAILSNAQAALQALEKENPQLGEIREILKDIVRDDQEASAVIGALNGRLRRKEARCQEISLVETIRETLALLRTELDEAGIQPRLCCETDSVALADKAQIELVLTNLLANAIVALQSQPEDQRRLEVTLSAAEPGMAQVTVSDTGPGIRDTQSRNLFDPFWTAGGRGTGIGLSICRSIVQAHGGRIWYRTNEQGGATFCFTVPLETAADRERRASGPSSSEAGRSLPKETRILIVDDSLPSRRPTWFLLASLSLTELAGEAADGLQ